MSETANEALANDKPGKSRRKKKKKRRLNHKYATDNAREMLIQKARTAAVNANEYPEIRKPLLAWGLKKRILAQGLEMVESAEKVWHLQMNKKNAAVLASEQYREIIKEKRTIFVDHLKLARVAVKGNIHFVVALGLKGRRNTSLTGWLTEARLFYQNALEVEGILEALQKVGFTRDILQAGLDMIGEIDAAERKAVLAKGESIEATEKRDDVFEDLSLWLRSFTQVAKIVFSEGPEMQTLERLGIPAITTRKRRKKKQAEEQEGTEQEPYNF